MRKVKQNGDDESRFIQLLTWVRGNYFLLLMISFFIIGTVVLTLYTSRIQTKLIQHSTPENVKIYSQAVAEFRTLYTSEVVSKLKGKGVPVSHEYKKISGVACDVKYGVGEANWLS